MSFVEFLSHLDMDADAERLTDVQMIGRLKSINELRGEEHQAPGVVQRSLPVEGHEAAAVDQVHGGP